jgi:hypothetical protein
MQRFGRSWMSVLAPAAVVLTLSACSTDLGSINLIPKGDLRPDWLSYSGHKEEFTLREAGAADLVGPDGQCAAAPSRQEQAAGATPETAAVGISLQMTECDVVGRLGTPSQVEFGTSPRGERSAVLTYTRGARPGIYRFTAGRLTSMERGAESAPDRPKKAAPQQKKRS